MIDQQDKLYEDFEAVQQIPIVSTMLEVICLTTGMGFAAVARVTNDRWLACSVRDEVGFGLGAGGELKIETTICNEIRDNKKPVIIDHVDKDEYYSQHHTPKLYGLQSYISFPIILKNGDFFGTLCAIDAKPAQLENKKVIGTFAMFAELLSFHLQSIDLLKRSQAVLEETSWTLQHLQDENKQYHQISNHNLQEPLRKMRMYSDILINHTEAAEIEKAKEAALKIRSFSEEITKMIQDVTVFSDFNYGSAVFELVDLNKILASVYAQLTPKFIEKNIIVKNGIMPTVFAASIQMSHLFFHLINTFINFSIAGSSPTIVISSRNISKGQLSYPLAIADKLDYAEILIETEGVHIEQQKLEKLFDIFVHLEDNSAAHTYGTGLAYCYKIVHKLGGLLTAKSVLDKGASFSIILPTAKV